MEEQGEDSRKTMGDEGEQVTPHVLRGEREAGHGQIQELPSEAGRKEERDL